jgi:acetoin:2,6-dichlorophenolindophenol oxidoreductase subunit alpha
VHLTVDLLRHMLRARAFEDQIPPLAANGFVPGHTRARTGNEGVVVGLCAVLKEGDTVATYARTPLIARGSAPDRCFGELVGRQHGLCKGHGGSANLTDVSVGVYAAGAVFGYELPLACGLALAAQQRQTGNVAVAHAKPGTADSGLFHESLCLAVGWRLPVVFVLENDRPDERRSYGATGVHVDGNDVFAVRAAARDAIERARSGWGPTVIDAGVPGRDPIGHLEAELMSGNVMAPGDLMALRHETTGEMDLALRVAMAWPEVDVKRRFEDVWV